MTEKTKTLITPVCILSYPALDVARASDDDPNAKPKFQAAFIFTEEAQKDPLYKAMQAAAIAVAQAKFPGKDVVQMFKDGVENGGLRSPFRRNWEAKGYPKGSVYINARTTQRPGLVRADLTPVPVQEIRNVFYAGALVRAELNVFYYPPKKGNTGIGFGLNNLQFIRDGERLDNRANPEDVFTAVMNQQPDDISALLGNTDGGI